MQRIHEQPAHGCCAVIPDSAIYIEYNIPDGSPRASTQVLHPMIMPNTSNHAANHALHISL